MFMRVLTGLTGPAPQGGSPGSNAQSQIAERQTTDTLPPEFRKEPYFFPQVGAS